MPFPDDRCGLCQGSTGLGRRADPDPGADGQVGQHQRTPGQRQRLLVQVSEHVRIGCSPLDAQGDHIINQLQLVEQIFANINPLILNESHCTSSQLVLGPLWY